DIGMSANARRSISAETALVAATEGGHASTIELLIGRGADVELRDSSDDTALRTALNWTHPDIARLLVSKGADANAVNKFDETALEHAIDESKNDDVALLLELGADPAFTRKGRSPMRAAIKNGDVETVQALLDRGCPASIVLDEC